MKKIEVEKRVKSLLSSRQLKCINYLNKGYLVLGVEAECYNSSWSYTLKFSNMRRSVNLSSKEISQLRMLDILTLFPGKGVLGLEACDA